MTEALEISQRIEREAKSCTKRDEKLTAAMMTAPAKLFTLCGFVGLSRLGNSQAGLLTYARDLEATYYWSVTKGRVKPDHPAARVAAALLADLTKTQPQIFGAQLPPARPPSPETDLEFWPVTRVFAKNIRYYKHHSVLHARVLTRPRGTVARETLGPGTRLFFYWNLAGKVRLAGSGTIETVRGKPGAETVECNVTNLCDSDLKTWAMSTYVGTIGKVVRGIHRNKKDLYVSLGLHGPDVNTWPSLMRSAAQRRRPMKGMTDHALRAVVGWPKSESGKKAKYTIAFWHINEKVVVENGFVTEIK